MEIDIKVNRTMNLCRCYVLAVQNIIYHGELTLLPNGLKSQNKLSASKCIVRKIT